MLHLYVRNMYLCSSSSAHYLLLLLLVALSRLAVVPHNTQQTAHACGPWVDSRKVIVAHHQFVQASWDSYQRGIGYNGGEAYWCASLDYTLRKLGFQVEFFPDLDEWLDIAANVAAVRSGRVYRVITNALFTRSDDDILHPALSDPLVRCRIRSFWGIGEDWQGSIGPVDVVRRSVATQQPYDWDLRTSLSLWPGKYGTPISALAHSTVSMRASRSNVGVWRNRSGLIYGKQCFKSTPPFVELLIQSGFQLHMTCKESMPSGIINHGPLKPDEFIKLLRKMAFVIGLGHPLDSPTPLEAIVNGAAWLNPSTIPVYDDTKVVKIVHSQHQGLKALGMPYVYNVDLANSTSVLLAAERAFKNRFYGFVPFWNREESVAAQVCSNLIESDAICACARAKRSDFHIDCRGSYYATNSDLMEDKLSAFAPV